MATYETTIYGQQKPSRANPARNAPPNVASGDVQYAVIPYVLHTSPALADADVIKLCVLPADVIPLPHLSSVVCDADPGTSITFDVGTAANDDGWADGLVLTASGKAEFCFSAVSPAPAWLAPTPLVADTGSGNAEVFATVKGAPSGVVAGMAVHFVLAYKRAK